MTQHCDCRDCSPEPERFCEACTEGDHAMCGRQTWCMCDCDPEAEMLRQPDEWDEWDEREEDGPLDLEDQLENAMNRAGFPSPTKPDEADSLK